MHALGGSAEMASTEALADAYTVVWVVWVVWAVVGVVVGVVVGIVVGVVNACGIQKPFHPICRANTGVSRSLVGESGTCVPLLTKFPPVATQ